MKAGDFSLLDGLLIATSVLLAALLLRRRVRDSPVWHATVTPLASIIGSGFLVVVPLLAAIAGKAAVVAMVAIVLASFWIGSALRYTILYGGRISATRFGPRFETVSDLALAFAYAISIAFYVRLMCGFVLTGFQMFTEFNADLLSTLILMFIGLYGAKRGLHGLERLETYSVTIKLSIIGALLLGLGWFDASQGYDLSGLTEPDSDQGQRLRELAGMLLIVQGFETSKYLAAVYDPGLRVRTMKSAQFIAACIYIAFIALAMPLMAPFVLIEPGETAIIDLSAKISVVLPTMLVIAAAMSQFSAAIADTIGAGGVVELVTRAKITAGVSYPILTALAAGLIWVTNIFEVVALASRAFAFYYLLQAILALSLAAGIESGWRNRLRRLSFSCLALLMLSVVLFAKPAGG